MLYEELLSVGAILERSFGVRHFDVGESTWRDKVARSGEKPDRIPDVLKNLVQRHQIEAIGART